MLSIIAIAIVAEHQASQLGPQSLVVQSVTVLIESLSSIAGKLLWYVRQEMRSLRPIDAAAELRNLGFPEIFPEIILGTHKRLGHGFHTYFERPADFYRLLHETPDEVPFSDTVLPLHESNGDLFWSYAPPPVGLFIQHSIEWPPAKYRILGSSLAEYIEYEVRRLIDYGIEPDDLHFCGSLLGYPEIDRLISEYDAQDDE